MNRRGPGRKCCCHTGLFTRDIRLFSSHGWFLSRIIELSNWFIFTRRIAEGHGGLSRDLSFGPTDQREVICELSIFFFTRRIAEVTVLLSRIIELSNFFSHGESRDLCHELSNYRISFHTESLGIYVTNYRIVEFLFTRKITEVFFVTRHVLGHEFASCRISFFTRMVVGVMRVEL